MKDFLIILFLLSTSISCSELDFTGLFMASESDRDYKHFQKEISVKEKLLVTVENH